MNAADRFWNKVSLPHGTTDSDCWEWTASHNKQGYGKFSVSGHDVRAHRFSYMLHKGPIPTGFIVMHSCDCPKCVNPSHLNVGTPKDNSQDMLKKGRHVSTVKPQSMPRGENHHWRKHPESVNRMPGEKNHKAKIKEADVVKIRELAAIGMYQKDIGKLYGLTQGAVGFIVRRISWKHVSELAKESNA